jgi:hypothetical protein
MMALLALVLAPRRWDQPRSVGAPPRHVCVSQPFVHFASFVVN